MMARENPQAGYTALRNRLRNLGHELSRSTVKRILRDHGIEPAPERGRKTSWSSFLKVHMDAAAIAATDLFTVEVVTLSGLVRIIPLGGETFVGPYPNTFSTTTGKRPDVSGIDPQAILCHVSVWLQRRRGA